MYKSVKNKKTVSKARKVAPKSRKRMIRKLSRSIISRQEAEKPEIHEHSILLRDYVDQIFETDTLPKNDIQPVLLGLMGEIGSIMATATKYYREKNVYPEFHNSLEEEFGDTLWYFSTLCKRLNISIDDVFSKTIPNRRNESIVASDLQGIPLYYASVSKNQDIPHENFIALGKIAASLLKMHENSDKLMSLQKFAKIYLESLISANLIFSDVVQKNLKKTRDRFVKLNYSNLPLFDDKFPEDEQLPKKFKIEIYQKTYGKSYLRWNGVLIGEPLMDNNRDHDGYRYHDVLHLAHAAILHWSPVMRALMKRKRKSNKNFDEIQDGGRAIVKEEGLTDLIFARAKSLNLFENKDTIPFDILKTIQQFVKGYEVEQCPLKLWEKTILEGYKIFREVIKHNGGTIIGNLEERTIVYQFPKKH